MTKQALTVSHFVSNELRQYAQYDNERSIANLVDGLKSSQRKALYTMLETMPYGGSIKVSNLASRASDKTHYRHSEDSLSSTIVTLAQDYPGSNNVPIFDKEGQFGSKFDNSSSSYRYIFVKKPRSLDTLFNPTDNKLLKHHFYEEEKLEPFYYTPTLPLILINGTKGVGNGHASLILSHDVEDIKAAVCAILSETEVSPLVPYFEGFKGKVEAVADSRLQFTLTGSFKRISKTQTVITDLPPDGKYQYEKYKERVLLPLLEAKIIQGFDDNSNEESGWNIIIKHSREIGAYTDVKMEELFKLKMRITQNLTCWDEELKLRVFKDPIDLLKYWVDLRIRFLNRRIFHLVETAEEEALWQKHLCSLITIWNALTHELVKLSSADLATRLKELLNSDIPDEKQSQYIERFMSLQIRSLTKERAEKAQADMEKANELVEKYMETSAEELLLQEMC